MTSRPRRRLTSNTGAVRRDSSIWSPIRTRSLKKAPKRRACQGPGPTILTPTGIVMKKQRKTSIY